MLGRRYQVGATCRHHNVGQVRAFSDRLPSELGSGGRQWLDATLQHRTIRRAKA